MSAAAHQMSYSSDCKDPVVNALIAEVNKARDDAGIAPLQCDEQACKWAMRQAIFEEELQHWQPHISTGADRFFDCWQQFGARWNSTDEDPQCIDLIGEQLMSQAEQASTQELIAAAEATVSTGGDPVRSLLSAAHAPGCSLQQPETPL